MKRNPHAQYSLEIRREALKMLRSGVAIREVSRQLGPDPNTIREWIKRPAPMRSPSPKKEVTAQQYKKQRPSYASPAQAARVVELAAEVTGWNGEVVTADSNITCRRYGIAEIAEMVGLTVVQVERALGKRRRK